MSKLFITVLNMSFTASYCILVVIALRLLLRRLPKLFSYLLWSVVLFRLLCPVSITGDFSLLRINTHILSEETAAGIGYTSDADSSKEAALYSNAAAAGIAEVPTAKSLPAENIHGETKQSQMHMIIHALSSLWLLGIAVLILQSIISAVKLRRFLGNAVRIEENIYEKEGIDTPFVMGIIAPRIYLPRHLSDVERKYVLAHEGVHIARKDYIVKLLAYAAVCIHWFNPLVWLAFSLMEKDMEMSCDEAVLKKWGTDIREHYSRTLLSLSSETALLHGNPIAFSERNVKKRVENVLSYRKKTLLTVVLTATLIVAVSLGLAVNPQAASNTGTQTGSPESNAESLHTFIQNYAEAFCTRDGAAIVSLYADEATALADGEELLLEQLDEGFSFGWSSPWPFSNEYKYLINEDEQTADIWFYAITSEPHTSVWKQKIYYERTNGEYYLTKSTIQFLDGISNRAEFDEAYLIGGEYRFVDYLENGFSEAITFHIKDGASAIDYTEYREPETAAEYILNLSGGSATAQRASDGTAVVEYTFADGDCVMIPMIDANFDGQTQSDAGNTSNMTDTVNCEVWIPDLQVWNAKAP